MRHIEAIYGEALDDLLSVIADLHYRPYATDKVQISSHDLSDSRLAPLVRALMRAEAEVLVDKAEAGEETSYPDASEEQRQGEAGEWARGLRNRSSGAGSAALLTRIHQMFQGTNEVEGADVHRRFDIDLAVPPAIGDPVEANMPGPPDVGRDGGVGGVVDLVAQQHHGLQAVDRFCTHHGSGEHHVGTRYGHNGSLRPLGVVVQAGDETRGPMMPQRRHDGTRLSVIERLPLERQLTNIGCRGGHQLIHRDTPLPRHVDGDNADSPSHNCSQIVADLDRLDPFGDLILVLVEDPQTQPRHGVRVTGGEAHAGLCL